MISSPVSPLDQDSDNGDFWDNLRRKGHGYPEQDLLLAVLKDALINYRTGLRRPTKTFHADRAWFFDNDADRLFSFESVCAVLGLSAGKIRQHLLAWEVESKPSCNGKVFAKTDALPLSDQRFGNSAARRIESTAF